MLEQAGLYKVVLYENDGINITFNVDREVTALSTTGSEITLSDCDNSPKLKVDFVNAMNNEILFNYTINAKISDLETANIDEITNLLNNQYGFIPKLYFMNGKIKVINECFKAVQVDDLDNNVTNTFKISLETPVKTKTKIVNFV